MADDRELGPWTEALERVRARTPARIFVERGAAYSTRMALELRAAHASAVDAVWNEFDLEPDLPGDFVANWKLFQVASGVRSKSEVLLRPDKGRALSAVGRDLVLERCPAEKDLQIVIGDGLSRDAVVAQVPLLLPRLTEKAQVRGWSVGQPFAVRYCRVRLMNEIGELLRPRVLVLLIGERPGLATAQSLSAYMAYAPRPGHTDANRNLISNIHARGVGIEEAAERITNLAAMMIARRLSGTAVKEGRPQLSDRS